MSDRPKIVCLCGSTRFWETFSRVGWQETLAGSIVLSIGIAAPESMVLAHPDTPEGKDQKQRLDELHLKKVELADEIIILNIDGYIGESTSRELAYAQQLGKTIRFLEMRA